MGERGKREGEQAGVVDLKHGLFLAPTLLGESEEGGRIVF